MLRCKYESREKTTIDVINPFIVMQSKIYAHWLIINILLVFGLCMIFSYIRDLTRRDVPEQIKLKVRVLKDTVK